MTDVNSFPSRVPRTPILNNPEGGFVPPVGGYSGATARHYREMAEDPPRHHPIHRQQRTASGTPTIPGPPTGGADY